MGYRPGDLGRLHAEAVRQDEDEFLQGVKSFQNQSALTISTHSRSLPSDDRARTLH
ncbi:hypothetical protein CKCBHOJB_01726 [Thauera sp. GDN1]|nr:hypothetical protein CKCBHOJB_01726 [Thauera sp. GDN1]